jgi:hypothetical protein
MIRRPDRWSRQSGSVERFGELRPARASQFQVAFPVRAGRDDPRHDFEIRLRCGRGVWVMAAAHELHAVGAGLGALGLGEEQPRPLDRVDFVGFLEQQRAFEVARHAVEQPDGAPRTARLLGGRVARDREIQVEVDRDEETIDIRKITASISRSVNRNS